MPNYNITQCLTNNEYVISATTLGAGDTIGFYIGEDLLCGVVGDITSNSPTPISLYDGDVFSDCCDCLSATTDSLNFRFIVCDTLEEINIEATNFCTDYGLPLTGRTYEIKYGSETPFCARFTELSPTGQTNYYYSSGPFSLCENCGEEPELPISAGTEVFICYENCSGGTVTTSVVHPYWTNLYGQAVIQQDAITLGGNNGYYS